MNERSTLLRQAALLVVAFLATSILLVGGWTLVSRARVTPTTSPVSAESPGSGSSMTPSATLLPSGAVPSASAISLPSALPGSSGPPPTVVITGAGDIADCSLAGAQKTSDLLLHEQGFVFTVGDNAYENGSARDFSSCYKPTWGRVLDRTILPTAGNHDWQTKRAAGYLDYFGTSAAPDGVTWYSKDLGAWHVVILDSDCELVGGCGPGSPQGKWLAHDLAASTAHCTLAIWHHPRFSSGEHGNDPGVAPFWTALYAAGAELVVNGHDHDYERFAPQDPSGTEQRPRGIRELVAGTGGAVLRQFHTLAANSEFRLAGSWGVLRLTLHPANYDWEFLPVDGSIADSGSALCH